MESVGSFEAKTHLPSLLERVAKGETIIITKHGKPIARLVPPAMDGTTMSVSDAILGLIEFRKSHPLDRETLKSMVAEGRKY